MVWARRFWLRLQTLFRRDRSGQRLEDEIQFHLDQQIAENLAAGMSREEAAMPPCAPSAILPFSKKKRATPGAGPGSNKSPRTFATARERSGRILGSPWSQFWRSRSESA